MAEALDVWQEIVARMIDPTASPPDHVRMVREAMTPFVEFVRPFGPLPDDLPITQGSRFAARQLTALDFRRLAAALPALDAIEAEMGRLRRAAEEEHAIARDLLARARQEGAEEMRERAAKCADPPQAMLDYQGYAYCDIVPERESIAADIRALPIQPKDE